jgi:hypothetical protein
MVLEVLRLRGILPIAVLASGLYSFSDLHPPDSAAYLAQQEDREKLLGTHLH